MEFPFHFWLAEDGTGLCAFGRSVGALAARQELRA
jgi:hypothetical protein